MASGQRSLRFYFFLVLGVIVLVGLYVPRDSVSRRSQDYVDSLIKTPAQAEQQWRESGSSNHAAVEDDSPLSPPNSSPPPVDSSAFAPPPAGYRNPALQPPANPPAAGSLTGGSNAPVYNAPNPMGDYGYEKDKTRFELDLTDYSMPRIDVADLRKRPPHNYKGSGHPTFALFFTSRNSSLQDPYFLATHEVIYRLIWNEGTKSIKHPVTVFVPPWVDDTQRSWFQAVGALVREVEERPFRPSTQEVGGSIPQRFKDVFSKLDMWGHIEFTRILFLDSDAFPLVNVDALLEKDMAPEQQCIPSLMFQDHPVIGSDSSVCQYVFTGAEDLSVGSMTNVGVMVFKPNRAMHDLLIRRYQNASLLHDGFVDHSFLSFVFRPDGPFPVSRIDKAWNGDPGFRDQGHDLYIVHAKLWAVVSPDPHYWAGRIFSDTWAGLTRFYESNDFLRLRAQDGPQFGAS